MLPGQTVYNCFSVMTLTNHHGPWFTSWLLHDDHTPSVFLFLSIFTVITYIQSHYLGSKLLIQVCFPENSLKLFQL